MKKYAVLLNAKKYTVLLNTKIQLKNSQRRTTKRLEQNLPWCVKSLLVLHSGRHPLLLLHYRLTLIRTPRANRSNTINTIAKQGCGVGGFWVELDSQQYMESECLSDSGRPTGSFLTSHS